MSPTAESMVDGIAENKSNFAVIPLVEKVRRKDIWNALLTWRTLNAVLLWTFFQPDEYFQAQDPAWKLAFGAGAHPWKDGAFDGPWMTWEWQNRLRSSLYPVAIGAVYKVCDFLGSSIFPPIIQSKVLLAPPKLVGILTSAVMEYYNWKLAEKIFGIHSTEGNAVLLLSAFSPWQWYVSTRTFGNCIETALTVIALYHWPWSWFTSGAGTEMRIDDAKRLILSLLPAAFATILRPTNIIIWICLSLFTFGVASKSESSVLIRRSIFTGLFAISSSVLVDFLYYGQFTFPPLNFLTFNLTQDIAVFYGGMRLDYYFTEGIPLLLMTALPFAIIGYFQSLTGRHPTVASATPSSKIEPTILRTLAVLVLVVPSVFSFISHKEVRFIYPLLPILHILAARPLVAFFHPFPVPALAWRKALLGLLVGVNVIIAIYLGSFHGRGVINCEGFLRSEHERLNVGMTAFGETSNMNTTQVGFLMPCHSVPWRSKLIYPGLEAWALTCDPPLGLPREEKESYLDEADIFYKDPSAWMKKEFALRRRSWPMYLVFFDQLTDDLKKTVADGSYEEAWRGFNSLWHEDWRRRGDVVVWVKTKDYGGPGRRANAAPLGSRTVSSSAKQEYTHGEL